MLNHTYINLNPNTKFVIMKWLKWTYNPKYLLNNYFEMFDENIDNCNDDTINIYNMDKVSI